jgi:hypothetical protein
MSSTPSTAPFPSTFEAATEMAGVSLSDGAPFVGASVRDNTRGFTRELSLF